jgi:hypothetical protein
LNLRNKRITLNFIKKMDINKNIVIGEWFCADLGIYAMVAE